MGKRIEALFKLAAANNWIHQHWDNGGEREEAAKYLPHFG
jgi:hypothetical protein